MKIKITHIFCLAALLLLVSCSKVYYPAMYHQDISYLPTPTSFDSVKTANYVSAGLGVSSNANFNDQLVGGQLNLSRGHNFKNFDLAYGAFGVFGDYENDNINKGQPDYFTGKFYGAIGGRIAANVVIPAETADIRAIGIEAAYSHEFGAFADFRSNLYNNPLHDYYADPRTNLFTLGLTSEVVFHRYNNNNLQHGVSFFLGETLGHNVLDDTYYYTSDDTGSDRLFRSLYFKAGYFVKYKSYFAIAEVNTIQIAIKLGLAF